MISMKFTCYFGVLLVSVDCRAKTKKRGHSTKKVVLEKMRFSRKFPHSRKFGRAENRPKHVSDKLQVKALLPSGIKWDYRAKTDRSPNLCTTIHIIKIVILFHDCRKPATSSSQVVKIMLDHGINDFASDEKSFYRHTSILNSKV